MPGDHPVYLALAVPTAIDDRPAQLVLGVTVEPLLSQHGDERREEGSCQTRVKDGLDVDDGGIGASPLRENVAEVSWGLSKGNVGDDGKNGIAELRVIRLEGTLHIDNES